MGTELPAFMLGMSMGGFVVVNSAIKDETLANGVVLPAPMLSSLNKLASRHQPDTPSALNVHLDVLTYPALGGDGPKQQVPP